MTERKHITKEEINKFPGFKNHEEAVSFLKDKFGDDFLGPSRETKLEGRKLYSYSYVIDRETFERMGAWIFKNKTQIFPTSNPETKGFTSSYQTIYIYEDGEIVPGS
ncbi:hypothetical protein [Priestia megaterium]|uniref:hypothetical protein n=1 Tax=Priestia megaterium TaxID=1404 RepID=UPI002FFFEAE2